VGVGAVAVLGGVGCCAGGDVWGVVWGAGAGAEGGGAVAAMGWGRVLCWYLVLILTARRRVLGARSIVSPWFTPHGRTNPGA
jgi:hypothetical protein